ncbi:histidine kinase dimerization/phospho-acceptor domain-containing protein [Clostridium sp. DL-VIII]|uniref:HAMP domain-containing sensor histidine kinase n=1 Tax=Clostridium sp. DL-VIII TaxID=641107 RepID=UPI0005591857|nr:histidine kinase dimerization/phospho-acceptor domain-containing protein [Clostridium sp. DL-VIII]
MSKICTRSPFRSKIVVRLWLIMMLLVVFSVAFMWVVHIFLFEQNYVNSTVSEVQSRLKPIMEELKTKDLAYNEQLILSLSKTTNGKMMVIDGDGKLIALYSVGHKLDTQSMESMSGFIQYLKTSEEYQQVLQGKSYNKIIRNHSEPIALEIGIPVMYSNSQALVVLYQTMDQLHTVLQINRNQLVMLSIILTLVAALVAALLSRHFVKPIHMIKCTVDRLTKGELTATPGISLNDELGQLSNSVEALGQALQRVDVLRKEVIANVSHELRSPLALIRGYAEMVRDINWKDDEKRNEDLNLIIQESGRMSEMVSDIMDYSQLQAGYIKLKKDLYNLYEIVESEISQCEQSAAEYRITICLKSIRNDISANIDALKISQVMRNLLNNAINHTVDGGTISVVIEESNSAIRVSVTNPGKPIPEEDREIIWERYQRSQHHGGRKKGTGIGLSIVSTFLKAHDMLYGVSCKDGLTTFWFEYASNKKT